MQPAGQNPEALLTPGTLTVPLCLRTNASPFWIMLLLVSGRLDNGMISIWTGDETSATGSEPVPKTIGMLEVTALAASAPAVLAGAAAPTHL